YDLCVHSARMLELHPSGITIFIDRRTFRCGCSLAKHSGFDGGSPIARINRPGATAWAIAVPCGDFIGGLQVALGSRHHAAFAVSANDPTQAVRFTHDG